jgi:hypothetical protein
LYGTARVSHCYQPRDEATNWNEDPDLLSEVAVNAMLGDFRPSVVSRLAQLAVFWLADETEVAAKQE